MFTSGLLRRAVTTHESPILALEILKSYFLPTLITSFGEQVTVMFCDDSGIEPQIKATSLLSLTTYLRKSKKVTNPDIVLAVPLDILL